jgi:hypothetical protein
MWWSPSRREEPVTTFDLDFRPDTYWPWLPAEAQMLARIKGVARRQVARQVLATGGAAALDKSLFAESLSEEERRAVGRVHPFFMGGEYLPDLGEFDLELARIELASTTHDVMSVRACPLGARIAYSAVDEYETTFTFRPKTTSRPLRLRQLISLIESIEVLEQTEAAYPEGPGLPTSLRETRFDYDLDAAAGFVTVSSELYSQLADYYNADARAWLRRTRAEWGLDQTPDRDGEAR